MHLGFVLLTACGSIAFDPIGDSTGLLDAPCTGTTQCAGIMSRSLVAGQPVYFVLEAASGDRVMVEFENF